MKKRIHNFTLRPFLVVLGSSLFFLTSCGTKVTDYKERSPKFNFQTFFQGDLEAHGMVKSFQGLVSLTFVVQMKGTWNGNQGEIDEHFVYSDGSRSQRIWKISISESGEIQGTASDVNGVALGAISGNAFHWTYNLQVPYKKSTMSIDLDDWMFLIDETTLLNHTKMLKWGIPVGEIFLSIRKKTL